MANSIPPVPQVTKHGLSDPAWARWLSTLRTQAGNPSFNSISELPGSATGYGITSIDGIPIGVETPAAGDFTSLSATTADVEVLKVASGVNAKLGTAALSAGTVTVANTSITAASLILLTTQIPGGTGTVGAVYVSATAPGASFTIKSTSATDTSTVGYLIAEPG